MVKECNKLIVVLFINIQREQTDTLFSELDYLVMYRDLLNGNLEVLLFYVPLNDLIILYR
jgi:hypothetical protein